MCKGVAILIAVFTLGCANTHGVMLYENEVQEVCVRFGIMKFKRLRGIGFRFEGLGLDNTCRPKIIKAYEPIGKY